MRLCALVALALLVTSCGDKSSPTGPSSTTPPAPTFVGLTGSVASQAGARLAGATVTIHDGPNAGKSTATDGNGNYSFTGLTFGNGNVGVTASGFLEDVRGVVINGTNSLNFTLRTVDPWSQRGTGATVFDKPAYVTRVRVIGDYPGRTENFVVRCGGSLLVNEILGNGPISVGPHFEGTYSTPSCTMIEISFSTGVTWSLTEAR